MRRNRFAPASGAPSVPHRFGCGSWLKVNAGIADELLAFAQRTDGKTALYAHEQAHTAELSAQELAAFGRDAAAWAYFEACPAGYKKVMLHWVTTAKKPETRVERLAKLVEACRAGVRLR
jgi:uncharacterized protein YdeI (YjbR/CyaY-like superfamily)